MNTRGDKMDCEINKAVKRLNDARNMLDNANDFETIDYAIYEILAAEKEIELIVKKRKEEIANAKER